MKKQCFSRFTMHSLLIVLAVLPLALVAGSHLVCPPASLHTTQPIRPRMSEAYGNLPLSFEVNQGQTDPQVQFLSRGSGYSLFLTPTEAVIQLRNSDFGLRNEKTGASSTRTSNQPPATSDQRPATALRMKLVGANPEAPVTGLKELPGKVNYFLGNDPEKWRANVPTYAKVKYDDVYPGVDLVYYGNQQQLEYDFVVTPGADPEAIQFAFEGADQVEVDAQGDVVLHTAGGPVRQHKPVIYQDVDGIRQEIAGGYLLTDTRHVGFQVAAYDHNRPLVIDPVLIYSTFLGGGGNDIASALAVDSAGNVYLAGQTTSTNFPVVNPVQRTNAGGAFDIVVAKLNSAGTALLYSTYLGGSSDDRVLGIAVDSEGNAYLTGRTNSTNFPTVNPFQPTFGGGNNQGDAFVAKLDATGSTLVYSTYLGGSGNEVSFSIAVDSSANAYVTGLTGSTNFPTANALQPMFAGAGASGFGDAFVTKLNAAGTALVYSTYLGGADDEIAFRIAVDASGSAYVSGRTNSINFPVVNAVQPMFGGGSGGPASGDGFVTKLNPAGSALVYSTYLGGSGDESIGGIAVDGLGNAYLSGETTSTNFPTVNAMQPTFAGGPEDLFMAKLNPAGSALVYSTYLGGSGDEFGGSIAVDALGNAYRSGTTTSTNFPAVDPVQATFGGVSDAFVLKLVPDGSMLLFSTYLGGSRAEQGGQIAVDTSGIVYITGRTASIDFPVVNPLAVGRVYGGGSNDIFIAKIAP